MHVYIDIYSFISGDPLVDPAAAWAPRAPAPAQEARPPPASPTPGAIPVSKAESVAGDDVGDDFSSMDDMANFEGGIPKWQAKLPLEDGMNGTKKGVQLRFARQWANDHVSSPDAVEADQSKELMVWLRDFAVAETLSPQSILALSSNEVAVAMKRMLDRGAAIPARVWQSRFDSVLKQHVSQMQGILDDNAVNKFIDLVSCFKAVTDPQVVDDEGEIIDPDLPKVHLIPLPEKTRVQIFVQAAFVGYFTYMIMEALFHQRTFLFGLIILTTSHELSLSYH